MVLSRIISSNTEIKTLFFLKCLQSVIENQDESIRNDLPISAWKEVADRCHERGIFLHHTARTFRAMKWKQMCRYVKIHVEKGKMLTERDELVIQIRRLQVPDFCKSPESDEVFENTVDSNIISEDELLSEISEYPSPASPETNFTPEIPEFPPPLLNTEGNSEAVKAYLECCRLYQVKTNLEIEKLQLEKLKLQLEIQKLQTQ